MAKIDLKKKAKEQKTPVDDVSITRAHIKAVCPPNFAKALAAATSLGAMVDLLKDVQEARLELNREAKEIEALESKVKQYFVQELPKQKGTGATGIAGKRFRVQLKDKTSYSVGADSEAFYAYVKKNNAFDLLTRAVSAPAVEARLNAGKQIPGLSVFKYKSISLTKV